MKIWLNYYSEQFTETGNSCNGSLFRTWQGMLVMFISTEVKNEQIDIPHVSASKDQSCIQTWLNKNFANNPSKSFLSFLNICQYAQILSSARTKNTSL